MSDELLQKIKSLAVVHNWFDLGMQKNPWMISFSHPNNGRLNIYHTTMTVTLQGWNGSMRSWKNADLELIEDIFKNVIEE